MSVCILSGSPVWPSPPVVGPLRGPSLCVGPLWVGVGSTPVVFPFPVATVPCLASRSRSRSRSIDVYIAEGPPEFTRNPVQRAEAARWVWAHTQAADAQGLRAVYG